MTGIVTMDNRTLFLVNTSQCPTATDEELDFLEQVSVFASFVVVAVIVGKVGVHGLVIAIIFSIFTECKQKFKAFCCKLKEINLGSSPKSAFLFP